MWCVFKERGEKTSISDLTDCYVKINKNETANPNSKNSHVYQELNSIQANLSVNLRLVFDRHRNFLVSV